MTRSSNRIEMLLYFYIIMALEYQHMFFYSSRYMYTLLIYIKKKKQKTKLKENTLHTILITLLQYIDYSGALHNLITVLN